MTVKPIMNLNVKHAVADGRNRGLYGAAPNRSDIAIDYKTLITRSPHCRYFTSYTVAVLGFFCFLRAKPTIVTLKFM